MGLRVGERRWRVRPVKGFRRTSSKLDGRLQGVAEGRAVGWVWDPEAPDRRVEVLIEVEEQVVAEAVADRFRAELKEEGIGDGGHGFEVALPESLQDSSQVQLAVFGGSERISLKRSPSFWQSARPGSPWENVRFSHGRQAEVRTARDRTPEVPSPPDPASRAVVGKDGWLFDAAEFEPRRELDQGELHLCVEWLRTTALGCADLGIAYIAAVVPDKHRAVPEGAPIAPTPASSVTERLVRALRDVDEVELIDLRSVLADARHHGPCYQRTDADWNDRAGFFVARALIKEARKRTPELAVLPLEQLRLRRVANYRGSLADALMLEIDDGRLRPASFDTDVEEGVQADPAHLSAERIPVESHLVGDGQTHVRLLSRADDEAALRVSVVGSSACLAVLPWLAEVAGRTTFFWTAAPPMEPIELELPAALVHLLHDRDFIAVASAQP